MGGGKSKGPDSPDYVGLAREQGAQNRETAVWNAQLAKTNSNGPFGGTYWDGNTLNTYLSPAEQQKQYGQMGNVSNVNNALNQFWANNPNYGKGVDFSGAPGLVSNVNSATGDAARKQVQDAVYNQYASRLDPQFKQQQTDLETNLINKGFDPTSEGYRKQQDDFARQRTDAYQTASNNAVTAGEAAQQQAFQQAVQNAGINNQARQSYIDQMLQQQQGNQGLLSNLNSYLGLNMPQAAAAQQGGAQPADLLGASQSQYQAGLNQTSLANANNASTWGALGNLGSIAALYFSDARLKSNIEKVGETDKGVGVYEYDIADRRERGVLAQEVERKIADAVHETPSGVKMVDYSKVGKF